MQRTIFILAVLIAFHASAAPAAAPGALTVWVSADGAAPAPPALTVDGEPVAVEATPVVDGRLADGTAVDARVLVFTDESFAVAAARNRLLRSLAGELGALGPRDRLGLVAGGGDGELGMLADWSRALPTLEAAFGRAARRPTQGVERLGEQRQSERIGSGGLAGSFSSQSFSGGFAGNGRASLTGVGLRRAVEVAGQVEDLVAGATAAMAAYDGAPARSDGVPRRAMILLLGDWPVGPDAWVVDDEAGTAAGLPAARRLFQPLVDAAGRRGWALYPVLVAAWDRPTRDRWTRRDRAVDEVLDELAGATGGRRLAGDEPLLPAVLADLRGGWRLVVPGALDGDGGRHALAVSAPGAALRAPASFDDPAAGDVGRRLAAAMARFGDHRPGGLDAGAGGNPARPPRR